jgi:hypothetical protein
MALFSSLDRAAGHLEQRADELRRRSARLAAITQSVAWESPAATAFHHRSLTAQGQLRRCARDVDAVAEALRAHAHCARAVASVGSAVASAGHAIWDVVT